VPVTSRDVARLAGVSQPTVSRALRADPRISAATRARVADAARALGYIPSELGRSLRTRSTRQIAMVADLANQIYPTLVPALHDALGVAGYRLVVLAERPERPELSSVLERLLDRSSDGVVLTTTLLHSTVPVELHRNGIPFVLLNRTSDVVDADSVTVDNVGGAQRVGELLTELGHRRIAAIFGPPATSTGRDREQGFRHALAAAGLALDPALVRHGEFVAVVGESATADILASGPPPTALFCANDNIAIGALAHLHRAGVAVPADMTVVGFDDLEVSSWPWVDMTTVHSPLPDMARAAAELLLSRLAAPDGPARRRTFPARLVLRSSHGPLRR
jgi:LacI family transcriptional regulator